MKILTDEQARRWCQDWPVALKFNDDGIVLLPKEWSSYQVDISKIEWRDIVRIARGLAFIGCHSVEAFAGGLLWVRRIEIAVPEMEAVVRQALERFRNGYGELRPLEAAMAHLFRNDESNELAAVMLLVLLAEWDAYLIHPSGKWIATIDHDSYVKVISQSPENAEDASRSFVVI